MKSSRDTISVIFDDYEIEQLYNELNKVVPITKEIVKKHPMLCELYYICKDKIKRQIPTDDDD